MFSSSIEMEKYFEIRTEFLLELPVKALRLIWSCGPQSSRIQTPPVTHYTQACATWTIHILIFLHFIWNKFHEKSPRLRALVCYAHQATQLPTQPSSPPLLARPELWKIRDRFELVLLMHAWSLHRKSKTHFVAIKSSFVVDKNAFLYYRNPKYIHLSLDF